jgi:protein phosphatase
LLSSLSQIVKEAFEVQCNDFTDIVEEATHLICNEKEKIGCFNIVGRLVKMKPEGEAVIVGDLHGDMESLVDILQGSQILRKMKERKKVFLIFLGDYGDRGLFSAEVYYTVSKLKLLFPEQIVLMRGNHEGPEDLQASPHDLPLQFQRRFGKKWTEAYKKVCELFSCLYNAVLVENHLLMIHGGVPLYAKTLEDLAYAHLNHPKQRFLEEMLWSDPNEIINETCTSPRGAGRLFSEKVTNKVLKNFNVRILIRGHEACEEGFKINHKGKILTLFSRKGPPYFNLYGAYLDVDISQKFENAQQLIAYTHKF